MTISAQMVKNLRERTGAGFMDCKNALAESAGDVEKAIETLRLRGASRAAKRATREAKEGMVSSYIHSNDKIGVLLEINCETDFVARTEDFAQLTQDLCMQIAAMNPAYLDQDSVPSDVLDQEKKIFSQQAKDSGKPDKIIPKIVEGKLARFYKENCLLEQVFVKDDKKTIRDVVKEAVSKLGENIVVSRYARFQLGEKAAK